MRLPVPVTCVAVAALLVSLAREPAGAQANSAEPDSAQSRPAEPDSTRSDSAKPGSGKSGSAKPGRKSGPGKSSSPKSGSTKSSSARVEARLWLGHDSNLLDLSGVEREAFVNRGPNDFFAVDRLSDQFIQGEFGLEWEPPRPVALRPSLALGVERRQYLFNPIKSEDQLTAGLSSRPAKGTRVEFQAIFRPQVYSRHRFHFDALPGEPQFRAEVHRRWDFDLRLRQAVARRLFVEGLVDAATRRYRAPFEGRDRESFGGGGGLTRSFARDVTVRGAVRYRATWTRNDPWDPDDRSHRVWRASSGIEVGGLRVLRAIRLDLDLEWRRFTSTNPDDQDHFGRRDQGGELQLEVVRALSKSFDWASRATWRWRNSDFPTAAVDDEGPFEEAVFRTGVRWERKL